MDEEQIYLTQANNTQAESWQLMALQSILHVEQSITLLG